MTQDAPIREPIQPMPPSWSIWFQGMVKDLNKKLDASAQATDSAKLGGQLPAFYQAALGYTPVNKAGDTMTGGLGATTVKATTVAGFISSDGSKGYTGTVTTAILVGKTITIKDGIITGFA